MKLINYLLENTASKKKFFYYIFLSILSGLSSFAFIGFINYVLAGLINNPEHSYKQENAVIFAFIILFFIWSRRSLNLGIIDFAQRIFWRLRNRILVLILKAKYQDVHQRKDEIYSALTYDVNVLTQASMSVIQFLSSSIVGFACFVYIAFISFKLLAITFIVSALGLLVYYWGISISNKRFENARNLENVFIKYFNDVINGFKELFMSREKGAAIYERHIKKTSNAAFSNNVQAFTSFLNNELIGESFFYLLIAFVLVFSGTHFDIEVSVLVNFVFVLLYLMSAIETTVVLLPGLTRAKISAERLFLLKEELEKKEENTKVAKNRVKMEDFNGISIRNLSFTYQSADANFQIGPIDLELTKGEIVFLYGGNGSGKTTFINCLLGLLPLGKGEILFNNIPVTEDNFEDYKTLYSPIFYDYYLFDELYGIESTDQESIKYYLDLFEIAHKVEIKEGKINVEQLSAGQRKRLALIVAILEKHPVLVLDEWAADQDPYFRKKFYTIILPILQKKGFTILAITHDDQYYSYSDRLLKMNYGKLELG